MTKHCSIDYNPLGVQTDTIITKGNLASVIARAGVGKTPFLVQLALSCMMNHKKVLYVSLNDSVEKVSLWYKEVFKNLLDKNLICPPDALLDSFLEYRFIMTFKVDEFNLSSFEDRFSDITKQDVFVPDVVFIDGFPLNKTTDGVLKEIKDFALQNSAPIWFSGHIHRGEEPAKDGTPAPFFHVADNFDVVIHLQPKGKRIYVNFRKGFTHDSSRPVIQIEPASMLIMDLDE